MTTRQDRALDACLRWTARYEHHTQQAVACYNDRPAAQRHTRSARRIFIRHYGLLAAFARTLPPCSFSDVDQAIYRAACRNDRAPLETLLEVTP